MDSKHPGTDGPIVMQALWTPSITFIILVLVGAWVHIYTNNVDVKNLSFSLQDFLSRKQLYRVFTSPISHSSFLHLLFNVFALWSYRNIELQFGSMFILKYTVLLITCSRFMAVILLKYIAANRNIGIVGTILTNLTSLGFSGEILGWLAFQYVTQRKIWSGGLWLNPLFMILLPQILHPQQNPMFNFTGLICGFSLGLGLLKIMPNSYWTLAFIINIMTLMVWTSVSTPDFVNSLEDEDVFEIANTPRDAGGGSGDNGSSSNNSSTSDARLLGFESMIV